jgi:hypothetical protein
MRENPLMIHSYIPTFPLLCVAAQYSEQVYNKPSGKERDAHVDGDWRMGTKAMVIKSVPMDDMNVIVFAIRGTQTFLDWAVNLNSAPSAPIGFLVSFASPSNHFINRTVGRPWELLPCRISLCGPQYGQASCFPSPPPTRRRPSPIFLLAPHNWTLCWRGCRSPYI